MDPRSWPRQIQVSRQNPPVAPRGGGGKSGGALQKLRILCPKTAFLGPRLPQDPFKTAKRREAVRTLHVRLDLLVTKSPLLPSDSTICPRNGPKGAKNGPHWTQHLLASPKTKNGPYLGLRGSKPNSEGTLSTRTPPLFVVPKPHNPPTRRLDSHARHWSFGGTRGQLEPRTGRANGGSTRDPGAKEMIFSKVVWRPL